ncbi:hypothetical protein F4604DRAFT_1098727 [Suillus subluteus]|nr:hypothetical protein F4604DRAFT_1098727 [Suillus subluteus]
MSQLEAMARSVSECCSLSSSGTILGEYRPPSSSRCCGITCPQPAVAMACISSSSHVLFDIPFQLPLSTYDPVNCDTVISLPPLSEVPATPTSSSSSSFATNSHTTSRVVVIRNNDPDEGQSPQTTSHSNNGNDGNDGNDVASSVSSATPATVSVVVTITSAWTYDTTVSLENTSPGSVQPSPTETVTSVPSTSKSSPLSLVLDSDSPGSVQSSPTETVASVPSASKSNPFPLILGSTSPGSVQASPTGIVASAPSTSTPSTSKSSPLPLILGLVFGVIFLVALAVIIHKFRSRRRRRAELLPQPLPGHGNHDFPEWSMCFQEWSMRNPTPPASTPVTLERRPRAPPLVGRISDWRSRCRSPGDSSEPTSEVLSDPFADGSFAVSSRTSEPATNNHFAVFGERLSVLHTSDNSELNILVPIPPNARTSIHSSYISPTGHYRERHAPPATLAEDTAERS